MKQEKKKSVKASKYNEHVVLKDATFNGVLTALAASADKKVKATQVKTKK